MVAWLSLSYKSLNPMLVWSRCGLGIVVCSGGIFEVEVEFDEGTMASAHPPCVEALEELHAGDITHVEGMSRRLSAPSWAICLQAETYPSARGTAHTTAPERE